MNPSAAGHALSRRGFLLGAAATTMLLAGCGSGETAAAPAGKAAGFPVTVPGKLGSTTVNAAPQRVVACGYLRDTDLALALGANLVLATKNSSFASGLAPWAKPTTNPELVDASSGLPMEKIAGARPDLILASDDYKLATDYPTLAKMAPTLGYANGVGQDGWEQMIQRAGDILGKRPLADKLVEQVRAKIADARTQHPEFAGRTFTFGPVTPAGQLYTTSSATDAGASFFSQLGLKLSPKVTSLPRSSTAGKSVISPERLDLLDADVVILTYPNDKVRTEFEANPLFKNLPAVQRGAYLALDFPTAIAVAFPSVLSIPYGLDAAVPKLAAALKSF